MRYKSGTLLTISIEYMPEDKAQVSFLRTAFKLSRYVTTHLHAMRIQDRLESLGYHKADKYVGHRSTRFMYTIPPQPYKHNPIRYVEFRPTNHHAFNQMTIRRARGSKPAHTYYVSAKQTIHVVARLVALGGIFNADVSHKKCIYIDSPDFTG